MKLAQYEVKVWYDGLMQPVSFFVWGHDHTTEFLVLYDIDKIRVHHISLNKIFGYSTVIK